MAFNYAIKHALKNGKNGVKNGAEALVNGNGNGIKNGVPKGVKTKPDPLGGGNLAKAEFVKNRTNFVQELKDTPATFEVDKVSDRYSQFLNQPRQQLDDKIYPKEAGARYLQEAKDYWDEHQTFAGFKRYIDPVTGVATHRIKDNSTFLKSGQRAAKPKRLSNDAIERAKRDRWEAEQTLGPDARDELVHHKTPLGLLDRIAAGLTPAQRRRFYQRVHNNDRWSSLKVGNEAENLVGKVGDRSFHPVHVDVHQLIKMAGLDDATIDFTGATMAQRYGFLDEIAPLLDQIDSFIFGQRMAGKYPDVRHTSGPLAGQKKFKGYKRPPRSRR